MSKATQQKQRLRKLGRVWSAWENVEITDEIRAVSPYLANIHSLYRNSKFSVHCFAVPTPQGAFMQCDVKKWTGEEITWTELQRVKSEIFSPDAVALEVYPAQAIEWDIESHIRVLYVAPTSYELVFGLHLPTAFGGQA